MQETEEMAVDCDDDVRSEACMSGGGSVSTGNISHPPEKKQIFRTPCDGWHHGGGLCILSPFQAAPRPLNLHWEGVVGL